MSLFTFQPLPAYLKNVDELEVRDGAISVLVELVVHSCELLRLQEYSQLREHFLELESVERTRLVLIVFLSQS